jgi:hypothetical protein
MQSEFKQRLLNNAKNLWKSLASQFVTFSLSVWALVEQGVMTLPSFVTELLNQHPKIATMVWLVAFYVAKVIPQGGLMK